MCMMSWRGARRSVGRGEGSAAEGEHAGAAAAKMQGVSRQHSNCSDGKQQLPATTGVPWRTSLFFAAAVAVAGGCVALPLAVSDAAFTDKTDSSGQFA